MIQIGWLAIATATMMIARFGAAPRTGHEEPVKRMQGGVSKSSVPIHCLGVTEFSGVFQWEDELLGLHFYFVFAAVTVIVFTEKT